MNSSTLQVLVLDNTRVAKSFGSKSLVRAVLKSAPMGSEVIVRRPPDQDLPIGIHFDAIVISGSITSCFEQKEVWIKPYEQFVESHIKKNTPILGVCYGLQTLARCLARLEGEEPFFAKSKEPELGWQTIQKIEDSPLFEGIPQHFVTYESHYEEVSELPKKTRLLAKSDRCLVQAFESVDKPIYAIQFHPEYSIEEAEESLAEKIKKGERKEWILNAGKGKTLHTETVGNSIFGNFFGIAKKHRD